MQPSADMLTSLVGRQFLMQSPMHSDMIGLIIGCTLQKDRVHIDCAWLYKKVGNSYVEQVRRVVELMTRSYTYVEYPNGELTFYCLPISGDLMTIYPKGIELT